MSITPAQGIMGNDIIDIRSLKLIGIHGHAGVGKDTAAAWITQNHLNCYGESFAKPLKAACAAAFGLPLEHFNDPALKEQETFWGTTPRKIGQFVGTEMFRQHAADLYSDFSFADTSRSHWINLLEARLTGISAPPEGEGFYEPGDCVVISDVRFQDEADWIWNNGGHIIHIGRPGYEGKVGIPGHASESGITNWKPYHYAFIVNDSSLEVLYAQLTLILDKLPFQLTRTSY
jgi:hypothetical protein